MARTHPYRSALDTVPGSHPFPRSSRHHDAEIGVHRDRDGTEVRYTKRRLLPPLDDAAPEPGAPDSDTVGHTVREGERPDHLGHHYLGDADQWWRVADANPVLDPAELTAEPGRRIAVPRPGAYPDTPGAGRA